MQNRFLEPLEVNCGNACFINIFAFVALLLVLAALCTADLSAAAAAIVVVCTAAAVAVELRPYLGERRVYRAVLGIDGAWQLFFLRGRVRQGELVRSWGISAGPVIALEWRCSDGIIRRAWILRKQLPHPAWRRLRVRLRFA